jgi:hypothetical protein
MGEIATGLLGKRVVVLSDHQALCRAIELSLKCLLKMEIVERSSQMPVLRERPGARASLTGAIGQVPLLMISDKSIKPDRDAKIFHLRFPFDSDQLCDKVSEILIENV